MPHKKGSGNPLGINSNSDRIPFHPYYTLKDIVGFTLYLIIFITLFYSFQIF